MMLLPVLPQSSHEITLLLLLFLLLALASPNFLVPTLSEPLDFWRLDYWEDDLRRRRRFVRNPFGSTHLDVACKSLQEYGELAILAVKSAGFFCVYVYMRPSSNF